MDGCQYMKSKFSVGGHGSKDFDDNFEATFGEPLDPNDCTACRGRGRVADVQECADCGGTGRRAWQKSVQDFKNTCVR